jgi:ADP-heptose:LPS heptosyltransferase
VRFEAERIGIIKLGAIGDVVNSLPFVNRLRDAAPDARITWVIAPLSHALVAGHPAVDEFLVADVKQPGQWDAIVGGLRERRFDLVIDLQRILKSALLGLASGAPRRVGFDRARSKEGAWMFATHRIAPNPNPGVTVDQYLEFADFLGCPQTEPRFDLPVAPFPAAASGERRVVVHVGATKPANRWDLDKWTALCRRLVMDLGATVHLTGASAERAELERLVKTLGAAGSGAFVHAGKLSLKETGGLIRSSRLFIGSDTGPLHMAVALGTPVVALFGAPDPRRTGPWRRPEAVLVHAVPCSPCRRRECNVAGHPCMRDLEVSTVFERARLHLA